MILRILAFFSSSFSRKIHHPWRPLSLPQYYRLVSILIKKKKHPQLVGDVLWFDLCKAAGCIFVLARRHVVPCHRCHPWESPNRWVFFSMEKVILIEKRENKQTPMVSSFSCTHILFIYHELLRGKFGTWQRDIL